MLILAYAIGWVVVAAFAVTFAVTILALVDGVTMAEHYLDRLFMVLVAEMIPAGFFLFRVGVKEEANSKTLAEFKRAIARLDGVRPDEVSLEYIQRRQIASPPGRDCWDYNAVIYWYPEYTEKLFNHDGGTPGFRPINPRSEGRLHYYKTQAGGFKGFSTWVAKNGELSFSQLVVIHSEFEFGSSGELKKTCINIAFRKTLREFSYGPFTHYHMRFTAWSETGLRGKMLLVQNSNGETETEVGEVVMELD